MMRGDIRPLLLLLLLLLLLSGCGSSGNGPLPEGAVAVFRGEPIPLVEFQEYLDFSMPPGEEPPKEEQADLDRVRSRIFDDFLDERILSVEADHRYPDDPEPLERLFAELARNALERNPITPEEVESYLRKQAAGVEKDRALVLRSLMFDSGEQARKAYLDIRRNRITFGDAVAAHETTPGQAAPGPTTLSALPEPVRQAVEGLKPGWVSKPVEVQGNHYLFQVEKWIDLEKPMDDPDRQAQAVADIRSRRVQAATAGLLRELKEKVGIRVDRSRLPFRYVPDPAVRIE